ncbi:MAG: M20 metallopeptidase family protein [Aminivibrio sp.]|jgi:amidohydrolase
MKEQIWKLVDEVADFATAARRRFHENPELGFEEFETTAFIKKELEAAGVEIVPIDMETGALAVIKGTAEWKGGGEPPVVGVRADMDALPIQEETGVPYASKIDGIMHACGHDGHAATLLALARVLQKLRPHFAGTVKLFFQPAEETLYGAERMIACGVMENPRPDAIVALHGGVELPIGTVGVYPGPFMASADLFKVKFTGKGTHAAYPHKGTDALAAAAQAVISLQMLLAREVDVNERAVVSVCQIHGGNAFNVVPEEVEIGGTVRCLSPDVRKQISERLQAICSDIASSYRCKAVCEYTFGIPSLSNDPEVTEGIAAAAAAMLGEDKVVRIANPIMGGEDFAYFLEKAPGAMFRLGIGGEIPMLTHNPGFNFADESLPAGIAVLAKYVTDVLNPEGK